MLKLTLNHAGRESKVELDGVDISRHLSSITVTADVGELTRATLTYSGAVVIEGEAGQIEFQQRPLFVQCTDCQKTLQGEQHDALLVERTPISAEAREYEAVGNGASE